jgi:hypothetical protein
VAEDFDFLRRALLTPSNSLLDGGGSQSFWRPVAHQIYYEGLGPLILAHPAWVAALHALLLALASVLLYRVFRRTWSGPLAAAAASFPLLAESTRTLVCWPSHFVDLGAFLFSAIAVHEAAHRRLWSVLLAILAALLCKEITLVVAVLVPFVPCAFPDGPRGRVRVLAGVGLVVVGWALAYQWVRAHAGLELPHGIERDPAVLAAPFAERLRWALWNSLRAAFSLSLTRGPQDGPGLAAGALILAASIVVLARSARARARLAATRGWIVWGTAWCVLAWASVASIFPLWAPNRSQLGSLGLGAAGVALTAAAHPALAAALVVTRIGLLASGPATPPTITREPDRRGAFMDYTRLVRLQRLMRATRRALADRFPTLPRRATVVRHNLPLGAEYAFGGSHALQVWYRDSTLACVSYDDFVATPGRGVTAFVSYQADHEPEVVVLDPEAIRAQAIGLDHLREGRWLASLDALHRADSLQRDRRAAVFLGDLAGRRAYDLAQLARWAEAEVEARAALAAAREDVGARYVIALVLAARRDLMSSRAELDTLLAMRPGHRDALELLVLVDSLERRVP